RDALRAKGHEAELVIVATAGDQSAAPVEQIGVGVFTAALREAIADDVVDVAVHSYKDLPTAADPRFVIAAIPPREDYRDALVARDGLVLGEGNLDTRLSRVSNGDLDGVVVARAGLARIGRLDRITETLEPVQMLPAPAQGALAVECRSEVADLVAVLAELDHTDTRAAVTA
ncbi:Porphobilinogen deaminase, partial [Aduncisulcus paluster]